MIDLESIAKALGRLDLENKALFYGIYSTLLKQHPLKKKAFIVRGEIVRSDGVKPYHGVQLAMQLEENYTHNIILQEKYVTKVEVALAKYLKPPRNHTEAIQRVRLFTERQPYHVMAPVCKSAK